MLLIVIFSKYLVVFSMGNGIKTFLVGATLAIAPLSDMKADNFIEADGSELLGGKFKKELFQGLNRDTSDEVVSLQGSRESETLFPIDAKIVTDAALSYFDEEVKLYSLKGEERERVNEILMNYLSVHPILKENSKGEILFIIDNKQQFASMITELANTLFDGMPKIIREIAILIAFGGNEELQKTLHNLSYTVMNLPSKQYKDIVFDYFGGIVKRVASSMGLKMTVRDYYTTVHEYYPNKNHDKILKELEKTGQLDDNIVNLIYPFRK